LSDYSAKTVKGETMKLKQLGANQTQITLNNGDVQFWSYETLVCVKRGYVIFETETKYSNTTSRHITNFKNAFPGCDVVLVGQEVLENDTFQS
jgi:hypothetical protein